MDWRFKRKNRALRNALIRVDKIQNKESLCLLERRLKEVGFMVCEKKRANCYVKKLGDKAKKTWNKSFKTK